MQTGEVVRDIHKKTMAEASCTKTIGQEVKWPSECVTKDHLIESLKQIDAHLHFKPDVDYAYIAESVVSKLLTAQEAALLIHIGKGLTAWNYYIGNVKDFYGVVTPKHTAQVLSGLEAKGAIRVTHRDKPFRHDLVLKITPAIAFRGTKRYREGCLREWYR